MVPPADLPADCGVALAGGQLEGGEVFECGDVGFFPVAAAADHAVRIERQPECRRAQQQVVHLAGGCGCGVHALPGQVPLDRGEVIGDCLLLAEERSARPPAHQPGNAAE
ncbi:hypothetical protein P3H15_49825 [Rhodococcus sp. T2V]|uniref:hypothetical protein n=1 Tax=Rhodococcus sp. T2V TaxID=3034164 RepID=UPI0023E329B1|nr:hypothetical protein [Rhodococcus sp. T2V]MDF3313024.1 hypothetical protein [Rhodococcus sp. T2V]